MNSVKKSTYWLYLLLPLVVILITLFNIRKYSILSLGIAFLTLVFMYLPFLVERKFHFKISSEFTIIFLVFLFLAMFLGTANHFYDQFWWWDNMSHAFSGVVFADLGYLIARYLTKENPDNNLLTVLFALCFGISTGAVWEIYEFTMDHIFGTLYQGIGIADTMSDIILDTLGALVFSIVVRFRKNIVKGYL